MFGIKNFFGSSTANETFKLLTDSHPGNGIAALPRNLTINGTTVAPTFVYEAKNATTSTWTATVGENLTGAGSGGTTGLDAPFTDDTEAVNGDATRYWIGSDNDIGNITTEDFVVEVVFKNVSSANGRILSKYISGGGYTVYKNSTTLAVFLDGVANATVSTLSNILVGAWYHAILFVDKSGFGQWYVNGVASGAAVDVSSVGTITQPSYAVTINADPNGTNDGNCDIAYLAMWKQDSWLDTHLQATLAQERFYKLAGIYPELAKGTALPTSYTRATTAYLDKETDGGNVANAFSSVEWNVLNVTKTESGTSPSGATAYILNEGTATGTHSLSDSALVTPNVGDLYDLSVELKAINRSWAWVSMYGVTELHNGHNVDLTNGVFGTGYGNVVSKKLESIGNDWYRLTFRCVFDTSEAKMFIIYAGEANADVNFTGLNQDSIYVANPVLKKIDKKLFQVGSGWPRVCQRTDLSGSSFTGYLPEEAETNLFTYSQDFDNAAWTKIRSFISGSAGTAPDGSNNASILVEDGTATQNHYIEETVTGLTTSTQYCYSIWAKAINRSWILIYENTATEGVYFDLSSGTKGSDFNSPDNSGIEDWGNGWFRCWFTFTADGTTAAFRVFAAEADADFTFSGLSQDSIYIWQADVVEAPYPVSPIYTSGSTATRNADVLYYKADDGNVVNNQQGTLACDILLDNIDTPSQLWYLSLNDGGSSADHITLGHTAGDVPRLVSAATGGDGGNVQGTTDIYDGVKKSVRATWQTNSLKLYIDGTEEGTEDTAIDPPNDIDRIRIGTYVGGTTGIQTALIGNIRIFNKPTLK